MWDTAEKRITNEKVRRPAGNSPTVKSVIEMPRCRWLSKLSAMEKSRYPRRMLGAWCPTPRPTARPQQTIRHAYTTTLESLVMKKKRATKGMGDRSLRWTNMGDQRRVLLRSSRVYSEYFSGEKIIQHIHILRQQKRENRQVKKSRPTDSTLNLRPAMYYVLARRKGLLRYAITRPIYQRCLVSTRLSRPRRTLLWDKLIPLQDLGV
jgi:hypothetical protein